MRAATKGHFISKVSDERNLNLAFSLRGFSFSSKVTACELIPTRGKEDLKRTLEQNRAH